MARLNFTGLELNTNTNTVEVTTSGSPVIQGTIFRSGAYAFRTNGLSSGAAMAAGFAFGSAAANGPFYFRFYFRVDTLPSADNRVFVINNGSGFAVPEVWLDLSSAGALELNDEDGVIGSSSNLTTGIWYRVEVEYDRTAAAGSHIINLYIDGTLSVSATNRSLSLGASSMHTGGNLNSEAQTTGDWYFDDIAVNDSTGSFQNSLPGSGEVIHLRPNAAGDADDWDLTTTYEDIDEVTPDDATTIISSLTSGEIHDVNIDATPGSMDSNDVINAVAVGVRFSESVGTDPDPQFVVRIKASSGGTVEESAAITASNTSFRTNNTDANIRNHPLVLYDLPGASTTAWTKADLDTAQIGVRLTNSPVGLCQVTTMWLAVDHKSASATTFPGYYGVIGFM